MKEKLVIKLFGVFSSYDDACLGKRNCTKLPVRKRYDGYIAGMIFKEITNLVRFYCPYFIIFFHDISASQGSVQFDRLSGLKISCKPSHEFPAGLGHLV